MIIPLDGKTNATQMLLIFSLIAFISMEHSISLYISLLLSYGFYFHVIWNCSCFMSQMKTVKRFCSKRKASFGIFFHRKKIYRPFFMRHTYTHTHWGCWTTEQMFCEIKIVRVEKRTTPHHILSSFGKLWQSQTRDVRKQKCWVSHK